MLSSLPKSKCFIPPVTCCRLLGQSTQKLCTVSNKVLYIQTVQYRVFHTLSTHGTLPPSRILFDPFHYTVLRGCCQYINTSHRARMRDSPCENCDRIYQTLQSSESQQGALKVTLCRVSGPDTHVNCSRRRGICMSDTCRRNAPGKCHTHRLPGYPIARWPRYSTLLW